MTAGKAGCRGPVRTVVRPAGPSLTAAIIPLAAVAAGAGLLLPGIYRDPAWLVPQARGQDLVTLLAVLALAIVYPAVRRCEARAVLAWLGLLGYLAYTYTGAAFAYSFNSLFLLYVVLFSLTVLELGRALANLDAEGIRNGFDGGTPVRPVAAFLALVALMLLVLWLSQIVPALVGGTVPDAVSRSNGSLKYVFALDLGLVVPASLLGAWWLLRRKAWGFVLAGLVLAKATTMGLALLSMTLFTVAGGQPAEPGLFIPWIVLFTGGGIMTAWYLRHCGRNQVK